jgi:hypothetical protein
MGAGTTLRSTSAAVDPEWLLRWANRRRQSAADVPCARFRHRPVGPGRRQGPAAGRGHSSGFTQMTAVKLQVGGTSAALGPGSLIRWAHRRRQSAADVPCARCRHRAVGLGRRQGPAASPTGVLTRVVKPQAQVSGTSTTTANHCKGPRRYQCLSRLGRSHTHVRTLACPPRCAGMARAEYHRHARSASCCCENMRMQGGEG